MLQAYQKPLAGNRFGIVFGTFAPMHQGHLKAILQAKKECDGVLVVCCGNNTDDKGSAIGLTLQKRYQYAREFFKDDDMVAVYAVHDPGESVYSFEGWGPWMDAFKSDVWSVAVENPLAHRVWYVGEPIYDHDLGLLGHDVVLLDRTENPISATAIRKQPLKHWDCIVPTFRRHFSHNILIVGTASEGKTNLTKDLARYFGTAWAHEWPRDYMERYCILDPDLDVLDFAEFLIGQRRHMLEQIESPENRGVFFCDTDALITNMYAEKYAREKQCALSEEDADDVLVPLVYTIAKSSKWDHIFFLQASAGFEDDHTRYMEHADLSIRNKMSSNLMWSLKYFYKEDRITMLSGSNYKKNFDTIVDYVKGVYASEGCI